ncbi:unnamed protein product [Vitrella brassicaformis CCMP3155]|uniref:Rubicon Homology domain-containing protein n=3 Tax=Vitrella brassicaformis TaxID=1169539 RepID=A0A0G4EAI0_VITBC|nr:unnamed protein product [Vitrella brassicaformis CCMP3155]|eukprot:CEL92263.1 unnamed protein product [Vitrella brassicaformis CCMP3155]
MRPWSTPHSTPPCVDPLEHEIRKYELPQSNTLPAIQHIRQLNTAIQRLILDVMGGDTPNGGKGGLTGWLNPLGGPGERWGEGMRALFRQIRSCLLLGFRRYQDVIDDAVFLLVVPEYLEHLDADLHLLIFLCVNKRLVAFINELFHDEGRMQHFYESWAVLRDEELFLSFTSALMALETLNFASPPELSSKFVALAIKNIKLRPLKVDLNRMKARNGIEPQPVEDRNKPISDFFLTCEACKLGLGHGPTARPFSSPPPPPPPQAVAAAAVANDNNNAAALHLHPIDEEEEEEDEYARSAADTDTDLSAERLLTGDDVEEDEEGPCPRRSVTEPAISHGGPSDGEGEGSEEEEEEEDGVDEPGRKSEGDSPSPYTEDDGVDLPVSLLAPGVSELSPDTPSLGHELGKYAAREADEPPMLPESDPGIIPPSHEAPTGAGETTHEDTATNDQDSPLLRLDDETPWDEGASLTSQHHHAAIHQPLLAAGSGTHDLLSMDQDELAAVFSSAGTAEAPVPPPTAAGREEQERPSSSEGEIIVDLENEEGEGEGVETLLELTDSIAPPSPSPSPSTPDAAPLPPPNPHSPPPAAPKNPLQDLFANVHGEGDEGEAEESPGDTSSFFSVLPAPSPPLVSRDTDARPGVCLPPPGVSLASALSERERFLALTQHYGEQQRCDSLSLSATGGSSHSHERDLPPSPSGSSISISGGGSSKPTFSEVYEIHRKLNLPPAYLLPTADVPAGDGGDEDTTTAPPPLAASSSDEKKQQQLQHGVSVEEGPSVSVKAGGRKRERDDGPGERREGEREASSSAGGGGGGGGGRADEPWSTSEALREEARRKCESSFLPAPYGVHVKWDLTPYPQPWKATQVAKQRGKCPGCGCVLSKSLLAPPRYCHYTGYYYCSECHRNDVRLIPALVVNEWDFMPRKVCRCVASFLDTVQSQPLIAISDIHPSVKVHQRCISEVHFLRRQLQGIRSIVQTCSQKAAFDKELHRLEPHIRSTAHLYSIKNLVSIATDAAGGPQPPMLSLGVSPKGSFPMGGAMMTRHGGLREKLLQINRRWIRHILTCSLCVTHGHLCSICAHRQPLFAYDVAVYHECETCKCVFHRACFRRSAGCPTCFRRPPPHTTARHTHTPASASASPSAAAAKAPPHALMVTASLSSPSSRTSSSKSGCSPSHPSPSLARKLPERFDIYTPDKDDIIADGHGDVATPQSTTVSGAADSEKSQGSSGGDGSTE